VAESIILQEQYEATADTPYRTSAVATECLHAFFQLLRRSAFVVPGMVAPFRVTLTSANGFFRASYMSLTRPQWEALYPGTAICLSALSRVLQRDPPGLAICSQWARVIGTGTRMAQGMDLHGYVWSFPCHLKGRVLQAVMGMMYTTLAFFPVSTSHLF